MLLSPRLGTGLCHRSLQASRHFVVRRFSLLLVLLLAVTAVFLFVRRSRALSIVGPVPFATAGVWNLAGGGSWNTASNWNPATVPNATGDSATFNGAATANNPAQTANRTVTLDAQQTVGSIIFNNDLSTFTNTLSPGAGGSLVLDQTGAGPATILTMGTGTGNNTISAPIILIDSLTANSNTNTASSPNGSLNVTGVISGSGGITKQGPATITLAAANTYAGGTTVSTGTLQLNTAAASLGSGNVSVTSGILRINSGVTNAISDAATLSLSDVPVPGVFDGGGAELGAGVNETVGALVLDGVAQAPGTYGTTGSAATNKRNAYFNGPGIITVSAPPTLGNYPNATVAPSGGITVTPSAAPTNTVRINVSTNTNFKGTFAADPATGVVRITDAHPLGTYTVTVRAFESGGLSVTKTFTLTVQASTACLVTPAFTNAADSAVGDAPQSVAIGDFNNDGRQDIAVANSGSANVSIRLGDGLGGFNTVPDVGVGPNPVSIAIGDFNNDGRQDFATANLNSNNASIRLGDGSGGFSAAPDVGVGGQHVFVAVGDFNNDGRQDLAIANPNSNIVLIRL